MTAQPPCVRCEFLAATSTVILSDCQVDGTSLPRLRVDLKKRTCGSKLRLVGVLVGWQCAVSFLCKSSRRSFELSALFHVGVEYSGQ